MTAVAMHGTNIATGWLALLMILAWIGLACSIVFVFLLVWVWFSQWRDELLRKRRHRARPGPLPDGVTRRFREPFDRDRLPESGISTADLERWPVMSKEPRS